MGFSADWLAKREPVDHASINPEVRHALARLFADHATVAVVDLGCGAGSNLRGLAPDLPANQRWTLVDYDAGLLDEARRRLSSWADEALTDGAYLHLSLGDKRLMVDFHVEDLSAGYPARLFADADLVTAAALFDLVSIASIERLAETLAPLRKTFCTVLTYDGNASWSPPHPQDAAIRNAFNAHQITDKGFGPAAGPGASSALASAFHACGYRILRGTSPWLVDEAHPQLRIELDKGFASAAAQTGQVPPADVEAWLRHRLSEGLRATVVGHEDLLAIPG